ncbi:MAG: DNA topology modulation protein [Pseudomonadota bacterium]
MTINRIMIFGRSGSGKSTFALKLHQKLGFPVYHLDRYFFVQNWQERDYQEFMDIQQKLVAQEQWIIDGTQVKSLETRYQRADVCIYFNYPFWRCLWRIVKRRLRKDSRILDRAEGCPEKIAWKLIVYTWRFRERVQGATANLRQKYPDVQFIEVRSDQDLPGVMETLIKMR